MSNQSQVTVSNLALLSVGVQQQVSSIFPSDGSAQANAISTLFSFVFEQLARSSQWSCLSKQASLTLVQAAQGTPENPDGTSLPVPQQPYSYGYLYPADCLAVRQIYPPYNTTSGSGIPQISISNAAPLVVPGDDAIVFEVAYSTDENNNPFEVVLTNQQQAVAGYTVNQQNPQSWDSLFTSAYVASLAVYLVPALSLDKSLMTMQIKAAENLINTAQTQDGNEAIITMDRVPDWLRARSGSTGYYSYAGMNGYSAYNAMNWPG